MSVRNPESFWGKYRHFKGGIYSAYAQAKDNLENEFILYQQLYDDHSFWIRPKKMFDEIVNTLDQKGTVQRFSRYGKDRLSEEQGISEILKLMEKGPLIVKHSESLEKYFVSSLSTSAPTFNVLPLNETPIGGYLTDFQLARRMGYHLAYLNGKYIIHDLPKDAKLIEAQKLIVDHESINSTNIVSLIGAASIDLRIADNGFLKTKKAVVDLVDLNHISNAKSLWKKVKLKNKNKNESLYFELKRGESIVTHTLEKIRIPLDCAGKIEIRSTYARLSLSVTTGDYCNPGYHGFYPLVLRNDGKHTLRIHAKEPMLQLILVSLSGCVVKDYPTRASFANAKGVDEGNPYDFYRADVVKRMRRAIGYDDIVKIYDATLKTMNATNTTNPAQTKERFKDVFLSFCSSRVQRRKYILETSPTCNQKFDTYKLWKDFTQQEKNIQSLFSIKAKLVSGVLPVASWVVPLIVNNDTNYMTILYWGIPVTVAYVIIMVLLVAFDPKVYCTCEKIDYDTLKPDPSLQP